MIEGSQNSDRFSIITRLRRPERETEREDEQK